MREYQHRNQNSNTNHPALWQILLHQELVPIFAKQIFKHGAKYGILRIF